MNKLYIFDLDGTLIDSCKSIAYAMNTILKRNSLKEIEEDRYNFLLGDGPEVLMQRVLDIQEEEGTLTKSDREKIEKEILAEYLDYYGNMDDSDMKTYPGIRKSLDKLKKDGKLLAVCTNKPQKATERILKNIFGEDYFFDILSFDGTMPRKPDPYMVDRIIEKSGLDKEEVIYFGDTNTDIKTCINAKIKSVGVSWGFRDKKELEETGASYIIDDPKKIQEF